jgi:phage shock protein B
MSDVIPVLLLTICFPLWIVFHYVTKWKTAKGLTSEDERMLGEIWESSNRMEERIDTLERILDIEAPNWRGRHGQN